MNSRVIVRTAMKVCFIFPYCGDGVALFSAAFHLFNTAWASSFIKFSLTSFPGLPVLVLRFVFSIIHGSGRA